VAHSAQIFRRLFFTATELTKRDFRDMAAVLESHLQNRENVPGMALITT